MANHQCDLMRLAFKKLPTYDHLTTLVKPFHTFCDRGHEKNALILGLYEDFGIYYQCQVEGCHQQWVVCCKCRKNRSKMTSRKAVWNHKNKLHNSKRAKDGVEEPRNETLKRKSTDGMLPIDPSATTKRHCEGQLSSWEDLSTDALGLEQGVVCDHTSVDDCDIECYDPDNSSERLDNGQVLTATHQINFKDIPENGALWFASSRNERFFQFCRSRPPNSSLANAGVEYLTKQCLMDKSLELSDIRNIDAVPVKFQEMLMESAFLSFRTGKRERELFCGIVRKVHSGGMEDGWCMNLEVINEKYNELHPVSPTGRDYIRREVSPHFNEAHCKQGAHRFSLSIPMTPEQIRSAFIDKKNSILQNLPMPDVKADIPDHGYVSLEDCIRDALAFSQCRIQVIEPFPPGLRKKMKWMCKEGVNNTDEDYPAPRLMQRMIDYDSDATDPMDVGTTNDAANNLLSLAQQRMVRDTGTSVDHPSRSKRALEIWDCSTSQDKDGEVVVIYLNFWSDDCDTNSTSMAGRAQVWTKTMTIAGTKENGNSAENTYLVAVGLKGASHDEVERRHAEDLRMLQSSELQPFFVGENNKMIKCRFEVLANLGDQPEKRTMNGVVLGSGLWGARSFVSANHDALYGKLKACSRCIEVMRERDTQARCALPLPECSNCLNFDVLKEDSSLSLVRTPLDYPYECDGGLLKVPGNVNRVVWRDGRTYIRPFKISYRSLEAAISEAHLGFCEYDWDKKHCKSFLTVENLNTQSIEQFLEYAERAKAYKRALDGNIDEVLRARLISEYEKDPALFGKMPLPAVHSRPGVPLSTHVEGIMHLIALGIIKASVLLLQKGMKHERRHAAFKSTNAKNLRLLTALNMEWLKMLEVGTGDKFHGWNSVNFLAFARVSRWFYQNYSEAGKEATVPVELPPDELQAQWVMTHNKHWLRIRRLNMNGDAKALRAKVAYYMKMTPPPPILPSLVIEVREVECLLSSLQELLECVFAPTVSERSINRTQYAIRMFLSDYDNLDTKIRNPTKKPSIVTKYNFACLLNLPEQMRTYGPQRHLWEGGLQGEGFLPIVKFWHSQGIRTNWAPNLLKNVQRERAFLNLLKPKKTPARGGPSDLRDLMGNFNKYSCILEVQEALQKQDRAEKKALSIILVTDGASDGAAKMFAVVGNEYQVLELVKADGTIAGDTGGKRKLGIYYYRFCLLRSDITCTWEDALSSFTAPLIGYAVLLPLLDREASAGNCRFALVSSTWNCLGLNNNLSNLVEAGRVTALPL